MSENQIKQEESLKSLRTVREIIHNEFNMLNSELKKRSMGDNGVSEILEGMSKNIEACRYIEMLISDIEFEKEYLS